MMITLLYGGVDSSGARHGLLYRRGRLAKREAGGPRRPELREKTTGSEWSAGPPVKTTTCWGGGGVTMVKTASLIDEPGDDCPPLLWTM